MIAVVKRGIEYSPDAEDPRKVKLHTGLPEGVSRAEVTFRIPGGLRGSRVVRASEAEFAHLRTATDSVYEGPWSEPRQVTVSEGRWYIAQAERRIAERAAGIQRRQARIDLDCPWCERPRTYLGLIGFVTGHSGFFTDVPSELGQAVEKQHGYRCDGCGSMLYFADGILPHPLPGRSPLS